MVLGCKSLIVVVVGFVAAAAMAFPKIPKESAKALGATKGKSIDEGVVFVNGKYLPPPYVVERWGTGLRINGRKVSGQVIDWSEFVKTQSGVKVTKTTAPAAPQPVELAPEPGSAEDDSDSSLDDLFDDDAGKKKPKAKARKPVVRKAPPAPVTTTTYSMEGDFTPNDASKALLGRINGVRRDIDLTLRKGGFICFGDGYARISGDARTAERLMETLPDLLQHNDTPQAFLSAVHGANLELLTGPLCDDLFRNRIDYRILRDRSQQLKKDKEWKKALESSGLPSY